MTDKKKPAAPKVPEIWRGVIIDKALAKRCLVVDVDQGLHLFSSLQASKILMDDRVLCRFENFDKFEGEVTNQRLSLMHLQRFNAPIPAKEDHVNVCLYVWMASCRKAKDWDHLPTSSGAPPKPKLLDREYELCIDPADDKSVGDLRTPQALTCLKILRESVDKSTKRITERDLRDVVMKRQLELRTRQDPWRIFQYYRAELIKSKLVRCL